jgi:tRNA wybutosine-synthesizing protein 3
MGSLMAIIPTSFTSRKQKILQALAVPTEEYSDLSPKGSVDEGIRDLINEINALEGLVTTSSCAGRISVFLEGSKANSQTDNDRVDSQGLQAAVPGGKGRGGRWLFVSHDPVVLSKDSGQHSLSRLLNLSAKFNSSQAIDPTKTRFAKFQFEPVVI